MDFSAGSTGVGNIHTPTANQPLNASVVIERVGNRNKQISKAERHEVLRERFLFKHTKAPQFSFSQMKQLLHVDDETILRLERETGQKLRRAKSKRHKKSIR